MRPFLIYLLFPASLFAQNDSIAEDQILQKIEIGTPSDIYIRQMHFLQQPAVPVVHLQRKGCIYYLDSLYSGVILEPIYDSLYMLWDCKGGYLTGEKIVRQRFRSDEDFRTVYYSTAAASEGEMLVGFERYYANGRIQESGTTYRDHCLSAETIFGKQDADGNFRQYYENGQLQRSYTTRLQRFDGEYLEYHANGQLKEQRFYELGKSVGTWHQYSETGKRTGKLKFRPNRTKGRWNDERYRDVKRSDQKQALQFLRIAGECPPAA